MKISKKKIAQAALSHAYCYATEYQDTILSEKYGWVDQGNNITELCNNIKSLYTEHGSQFKHSSNWSNLGEKLANTVKSFYDAMLLVCPNHIALQWGEDMDHSGTEDRGWYRVWSDLTGYQNYFCQGDWGRDSAMAKVFYDNGCITADQYNKYKTKFTLRMLLDSWGYGIMRDNGTIDKEKLLSMVSPNYKDKIFNNAILEAI